MSSPVPQLESIIIAAAKSNPTAGLLKLLNYVRHQDDDDMLIVRMKPVFLHYATSHDIPSSTTSSSSHESFAKLIVLVFRCFAEALPDAALSDQTALDVVVFFWPILWGWSAYLANTFFEFGKSKNAALVRDAHFATSMLFCKLGTTPAMLLAITKDPATVRLITALWCRSFLIPASSGHAGAAFLLRRLIETRDNGEDVGEQLFALWDVACERGSKFLVFLKELAEKSLPSNDFSVVHNDVFILLECSKGSVFYQAALRSQGSITVVASIMSILSSVKGAVTPTIVRCLVTCAEYLELSILQSYTWATQAIDARVLLSILKSMRFLVIGKAEPALAKRLSKASISLLNAIKPYLSFYSVLTVVQRSLGDIQNDTAIVLDIRPSDSPLAREVKETWRAFRSMADNRMEYKVRWKTLRVLLCDNLSCPHTTPNELSSQCSDHLKKCTGCGTTIYCSAECQKEAWTFEHKKICKAIRMMKKAAAPQPLIMRDKMFHQHRIGHDLLVHRIDVLAREKAFRRAHPECKDQPVVHKVDYSLAEPVLTVHSVNEYLGLSWLPDIVWTLEIERAKRGKLDVLIHANIPQTNGVGKDLFMALKVWEMDTVV